MKRLVCLLAGLLLLVSFLPAPALASVPPLPHTFWGYLTINGEPAPVGTTVEARVQGGLVGIPGNPLITTQVGKYGGPGAFDPKLVVQGDIETGAIIEFYVNGFKADQTYEFTPGGITRLDLSVVIPRYILTIAIDPPASGTVSLSPEPDPDGKYTAQTEVTLTATPAAGWRFDRWSGDVTGTEPTVTLTMDAHKSVTAHFARVVVQPPPPVRYTLTVTVDPAQSGTVSLSPLQPAAGYLAGTTVTLTAEPAEGWEFDRWSGDAVGTEPVTTVTMTRHKSVTAHFVPVVPLPAEVVEEIAEIPPEVAIPEETIKDIEERPLQEAIEIVEGVSPERAAEIIEGVSIDRAIEVAERVGIERAVE
ncbi:hypothetical protein M1N20_02675, partial [Dehalococcoidia bacterium]|nr:hypothetical protein [Dehalococcoidia bacterium]